MHPEPTFHSLIREELAHIVRALSPVETFFHNPELFAAFETLLAHRGLSIRRIAVLGSDPGLDAYSVALTLAAFWRHTPPSFHVLGLLLVDEDVAVARRGVYPAGTLPHPVPQNILPWIARHRNPHIPLVRLRPEIRWRVRFRHLPWPCAIRLREPVDLLWCRGLFSLFVPPLGLRLLEETTRIVRPGGFVITDIDEVASPAVRSIHQWVYQKTASRSSP
jgi:chemotaxis methyl-accepting protein methylase